MTVTRAESGMEWTTVDGGCCKMAGAIFLYFSESRNLVVSPNCLVYCNGKRATPLCGISWQNLIRFYLRKSIKKERKTEAASTRRLLLRPEKSVCLPQTTPSPVQNQPRILSTSSASTREQLPPFAFVRSLPSPVSGRFVTRGQWPYRPAATRAMRNRLVVLYDLN